MSDTTTNAVTGARIDSVEVIAYTVPTDAPEADGTISWDSTTMVVVRGRPAARRHRVDVRPRRRAR